LVGCELAKPAAAVQHTVQVSEAEAIPAGFEPFVGRSSFAQAWQPLYVRTPTPRHSWGLHVRDQHCNSRGIAHGGLITTLADNAMGIAAERRDASSRRAAISGVVTAHLDVDFLAPAVLGSWLLFRASCDSTQGSLRFAACTVLESATLVARISGLYRVLGQRQPAA
jgi:acyl-coenzyme A thioesterase PaaI-like protein